MQWHPPLLFQVTHIFANCLSLPRLRSAGLRGAALWRRHLHPICLANRAFAVSHRRARGTNGGAVQVSNLQLSG